MRQVGKMVAGIVKDKLMVGLAVIAILLSAPVAQAGDCRITVLGDSLTAGYGLDEDDAFPAQLGRALAAIPDLDCSVANAGVSGDTSAGGLARLDWVLADKPTHLIVELGANDGLRALPTAQMEANLDAILARAGEEGISVLLAGMLAPPNLGQAYGDAFAAVFEKLAKKHDVAFYPFFLEGVAGNPLLLQRDGLHPNAAGVAVVVRNIMPQVVAWLRAGRD